MENQIYVIPLKDIFLNCKSLKDIFDILNDIGSDNLELIKPCDGENLVLKRLTDNEIEMLIAEDEEEFDEDEDEEEFDEDEDEEFDGEEDFDGDGKKENGNERFSEDSDIEE